MFYNLSCYYKDSAPTELFFAFFLTANRLLYGLQDIHTRDTNEITVVQTR